MLQTHCKITETNFLTIVSWFNVNGSSIVNLQSEKLFDKANEKGLFAAFQHFYVPAANALTKDEVTSRLTGLANRILAAENLDELDGVVNVSLHCVFSNLTS